VSALPKVSSLPKLGVLRSDPSSSWPHMSDWEQCYHLGNISNWRFLFQMQPFK
jgi:hypothetical protein